MAFLFECTIFIIFMNSSRCGNTVVAERAGAAREDVVSSLGHPLDGHQPERQLHGYVGH